MLAVGGELSHISLQSSTQNGTWETLADVNIPDIDNSGSEVSSMAWSPANPHLALCGRKWEHLYVLDCSNPCQPDTTKLAIHGGKFQNTCCFDTTGTWLASSGISGTVFLWELHDGVSTSEWKLVKELKNCSMSTVNHICWDPSATHICTGDTRGIVAVHTRGSCTRLEFSSPFSLQSDDRDEVTAMACNPYVPHQPAQIAVGYDSGSFRVWDIETRTIKINLRDCHTSVVTDVAYSTINGMLVAVGSLSGHIHLISLKEGKRIKTLELGGSPVNSLEFIKGTRSLAFITPNQFTTFTLSGAWSDRKVQETTGVLVRCKGARAPIEEKIEAYRMRTDTSPSQRKSLSRDTSLLASSLKRSNITPVISSREANTSCPPKINNIPTQPSPHENIPTQPSIPDMDDILAMADYDTSFSITEIANYTRDESTPESAPSRSRQHLARTLSAGAEEAGRKMRRIEEEAGNGDKENLPPVQQKQSTPDTTSKPSATPDLSKAGSSTPAVGVPVTTSGLKRECNFGTPISEQNNRRATNSTLQRTPTLSSQQNTTQSSNQDSLGISHISGLINSTRLNDLSERRAAGAGTPGNQGLSRGILANSTTSHHLNVPGADSSRATSIGMHQEMLTPEAAVVTSRMNDIETRMEANHAELKKLISSQCRWIKNEVVRQAVDTQFALEDRLNVMEQRQVLMEARQLQMEAVLRGISDNQF